jgi:hypothetical protein
MGTLTGMFNAWIWSLAIVTAKASCTRSPHQQIRTQEKEPIRKQDTKRNNQSTPSIQNLHSMKSRDKRAETHTSFDMYLPPPMGTLTGMFNAWIWSLAIVTAKASCTRSPLVRVNGMINALVWSFDFDLRDMSNEVCAWINIVAFWIERVQAISSMEI